MKFYLIFYKCVSLSLLAFLPITYTRSSSPPLVLHALTIFTLGQVKKYYNRVRIACPGAAFEHVSIWLRRCANRHKEVYVCVCVRACTFRPVVLEQQLVCLSFRSTQSRTARSDRTGQNAEQVDVTGSQPVLVSRAIFVSYWKRCHRTTFTAPCGPVIYIYKNECLYVCLSRMRSNTIHPIAMKLRWVVVRTPWKVYELLFSS
jgi:hypothetical protein